MKPALVFVYGTLKRGHRNNHILESSRFIGAGETAARCRLYDSGFPVLRRGGEHRELNAKVRGEVYLVTSEEVMRRLDSLESEGRMYHRTEILVHLDEGMRKRIKAFAYIGDTTFWTQRRVRLYITRNSRYEWPAERAP